MALLALASCEKEIPFEDVDEEIKIVVNGIQKVGEPARLSVEKSSFYIETQKDHRVKDVEVDLFVNGEFKEALQVRDSMTYYNVEWYGTDEITQELEYGFTYCEGSYLLCEGDELRFEVSSSEFDDVAVAEITMPLAPEVIGFDTIHIQYSEDHTYYTASFQLKIKDPVGADYYNLDPQGALDGFVTKDPVFQDLMNIVHVDDLFGGSEYYARKGYNPFSDAYFDGKEYSITMSVDHYGAEFYEPFTLIVSRVDQHLFQYQKSLNAYQQTDQGSLLGMFMEPVQVYSNVQNGIGVVCAQSQPVVLTIDLTTNE